MWTKGQIEEKKDEVFINFIITSVEGEKGEEVAETGARTGAGWARVETEVKRNTATIKFFHYQQINQVARQPGNQPTTQPGNQPIHSTRESTDRKMNNQSTSQPTKMQLNHETL